MDTLSLDVEMRNLSRRLMDDMEEWLRMFVEERNMRTDLACSHNKQMTLVNSLVNEVGRLQDDLGGLMQKFSRNLPRAVPLVDSAHPHVDQAQRVFGGA